MTDHVTQDQLNQHLVLIHQAIRDSNTRTERHLETLSNHMAAIAKESAETRTEILGIVKEHEVRLDAYGVKQGEQGQAITELQTHKVKTSVFWMIFGSVSSIALAAIVANSPIAKIF